MDEQIEELFTATQERTRAYKLAFGSPAGRLVLDDLVKFCCGTLSTVPIKGPINKDWMLLMEGRRQVFLLIHRMIGLTAEQVFQLAYGYRVEMSMEEQDDAA